MTSTVARTESIARHLGNLGPTGDLEGRSVIELRDQLGLARGHDRAHHRRSKARAQLDADATRAWAAEMASHRTKNIDAPSSLWQALVVLVAVHEHG
jgi:hypothetical protein